jgi:signal transduction histidine kinase
MLQSGFYGAITDKQARALKNISNSGHHLLMVVSDLLDIAAIEAGKMPLSYEETELLPVLKSCVDIIMPSAREKDLEILYEISAPVSCILVDPARMAQIFLNLLSNAVKYNQPGGKIMLRLYDSITEGTQIFQIEDTGIGIPESQIPLIFSEFHRVNSIKVRKQEGAGLGLVVTQKLVQLQGGTISVESREGVGTTFTLTFPIQQRKEERPPTL